MKAPKYLSYLTGIALAAYAIYTVYFAKTLSDSGKIISELKPLVAQVDGRPGISFEDQLDFAERAGVSHEIIEGKIFNFDNWRFSVPKSKLEQVLESYKSE